MAQPAPKPQISPTVIIKIQGGGVDNPDVYIKVGQEVEIHNTEKTPYEIPFSFSNSGGTTQFPLSIYLPPGGKLDLIGLQAATCQYFVNTAPNVSGNKGLKPASGPYTIGVGSGTPGGGKK
jgi:hypothetical protein